LISVPKKKFFTAGEGVLGYKVITTIKLNPEEIYNYNLSSVRSKKILKVYTASPLFGIKKVLLRTGASHPFLLYLVEGRRSRGPLNYLEL